MINLLCVLELLGISASQSVIDMDNSSNLEVPVSGNSVYFGLTTASDGGFFWELELSSDSKLATENSDGGLIESDSDQTIMMLGAPEEQEFEIHCTAACYVGYIENITLVNLQSWNPSSAETKIISIRVIS